MIDVTPIMGSPGMPKKVRKKIKYQAGVLERRKEGKKATESHMGGKGCRTGVYGQSMGCTGVLDCKELQKGLGDKCEGGSPDT